MNTDNGRLHFATGIDNSTLQSDAAQSRSILQGIGRTAEQEGNKIDAAFNRIGKTIVGVFTVQQAANYARQIVNVRGEIESLQKSFEILAGKQWGAKLFADIKDFAVNTPMMMNDIAKGAQTLLSFNVAAEEVMPILRAIGDISMGDAQKFNSLALAFSQMSSTGKLMGQDLLQMINAGFNPLSVIAEKTGKSIGELKEEMSAGSLSADKIKQAFMDATSEGGKFYNMLETQSKGIKGSISNLQGAIDDMLNSIGTNAQGIITGSIQAATELVKNYEKVGGVIAELVATYGVYKAALLTINALKSLSASLTAGWTAAELAHYNALALVEKAQALLNTTIMKNPYVLAAAAVSTLAYGIYKLITYQTDAEKAQERLNKTTSNMNKEIASERVQIDSLFARLKAAKEGTDEYKVAKQAIINQYGGYLKGLSSEIQSLKDVEAAYKAVTKAAQDAAKTRAFEKSAKDAADTYSKKEADVKDNVYELLQKKFKGQKGDDGLDIAETYYWKIVPVLEGKEEVSAEVQGIIDKFDSYGFSGGGSFSSGGSYQKNDLIDELNSLIEARSDFQKTMAETQRRFGVIQQTVTSNEEPAKTEVVKNRKYWEDYKKEQQGLLDAMTEAQLKTEEADKIRKNIADAQTKIDAYGVSKETKAEERTQKIREYAEDVAREARQAELDIEQARIDGMNEGLEKELAQNELNYKRLIEANVLRQAEMVERLRDVKELEWQNANPKAKEQGLTFDRSTVTAADLSSAQKTQLAEYERIAGELRNKALKEVNEKALQEVLTYEQKRNKIIEDFAQKRKNLVTVEMDEKGNSFEKLRDGVTQGNLDELNRQQTEALYALENDAKKVSSAITALFGDMSYKTTAEIKNIASKGREALAFLESGVYDAEKGSVIGISKEQYEFLRSTPTELKKIRKGIEECDSAATKSENAFEKMASGLKKIVSEGSNLSKLDEGLKTLQDGMKEVSAVLNFLEDSFSSLGDAFGSETLSAIGEGLGMVTDALNSTMQGAQAGAVFGPWGAAAGAAIGLATSIASSISKIHDKKHEKEITRLGEKINTLTKTYEMLDVSIDKAYSKDASNLIQQQNENLEEQKKLIEQQIAEEEEKKKTDQSRIKEWNQQIEDIDKQIAENKEAAVDVIFGEDLQSAIESFSDAYTNAWSNGTKGVATAKDYVRQMMRDMVTESIKAAIAASTKIEEIRKKLIEFYEDGLFDEAEKKWAERKAEELQNDLDSQFGWADDLFADKARESAKSGIATASQESVDELNGRATAIQGHTFSIAENTKLLVANSAAILESVLNIESHTEAISHRMENVEYGINGVREMVNDIVMKGIKVK